jgi:hypothetical protein
MNDADQALLFLLIVFYLGACFVTAFWGFEQARVRWRDREAVKARVARLVPLRRR